MYHTCRVHRGDGRSRLARFTIAESWLTAVSPSHGTSGFRRWRAGS